MKYKKSNFLCLILNISLFNISLIRCHNNTIRNLDEAINTSFIETDSINYTNYTLEGEKCFLLNDCFNCTVNPLCRWSSLNQSCTPFIPFNKNYTIPELNNSYFDNDIFTLNNYINFIRKACFLPYIPYYGNNNSIYYNNISSKYCGPHYIGISYNNFEEDFILELNNISGTFGAPNVLCEYIILSGPNSFTVNIELDETFNEDFFLLFSSDSQFFEYQIINNTELIIEDNSRKSNTFIFYGLKSFNTTPFRITFKKEEEDESSSQTLGYVMIGLIIFVFILIVSSTIYIRYNSDIFKDNKLNASDEQKNIKEKNDDQINNISVINTQIINNNDESTNIKSNIIYKNNNMNNTMDKFISKEDQNIFNFNNIEPQQFEKYKCCSCNNIIINQNELFKSKCGHIYHLNCYNLLFKDIKNNENIGCVFCNEKINPI